MNDPGKIDLQTLEKIHSTLEELDNLVREGMNNRRMDRTSAWLISRIGRMVERLWDLTDCTKE